ncbi:MAG: sensor histidine kinase, partial [Acidimicrobiales bacterium]
MTSVPRRTNVAHAVRVAAIATAVIAFLYVVVVGVFDILVVHRLVSQVDTRLNDRLVDAVRRPASLPGSLEPIGSAPASARFDTDVDAAPVFLWRFGPTGTLQTSDPGAPALPAGAWARHGGATTAVVGSSSFRFRAVSYDGGWLVAGLSLAEQSHVQGLLFEGEAIAGPIVLLAMFLGSIVIGLKASAPVEHARRRQLEFTADASHELRTPLSVIEAEVDLALAAHRDATAYREALARVGDESGRLLHIVEDLLWLARFDSAPPPPQHEPIDLDSIAEVCAERFGALATARRIALSVERWGEGLAWVNAPPAWIDRLAGVLVDNACQYTPAGGSARILVETRAGRVILAVEDSGPGIPFEARSGLFDRFRRGTDAQGGTGLGLAIAD